MKSDTAKREFKKGSSDRFKTILDGLVTAGTITQDQETAIENAVTAARNSGAGKSEFNKGSNRIKTILDTLVTSGTINQTQEDAILSL